MKLDKEWQERCRLRAEGDKLRREAYKLHIEGDKLRREAYKLHTEGYTLRKKADVFWKNAILREYGHVRLEYTLEGHVVNGKDTYLYPDEAGPDDGHELLEPLFWRARHMRLDKEWQERCRLEAEGHKLCAEGKKKRLAECNKLYAEGRELYAKGDLLWINAILQKYGNVSVEYTPQGCIVDGKDTYLYPDGRRVKDA